MGDTVLRTAILVALCAVTAHASGCRSGRSAEKALAGPSCRDVATRAAEVIEKTPEGARDDATRFYAEVIDLCQEPGLAQRARSCLAAAADVASARGCPSLPAVADTSAESERGPPSCGTVVAHAMRVLDREPDTVVSPTDKAEEERLFMRDCAAASVPGRRCAIKALTVDALDECLAMRDNDDADDEDDQSGDGPD